MDFQTMPDVSIAAGLFLTFIIVQRLGELVLAKRNTKRLLARGAYEVTARECQAIANSG